MSMCRNFRLQASLTNESFTFFFYCTIYLTMQLIRHQVVERLQFPSQKMFEVEQNVDIVEKNIRVKLFFPPLHVSCFMSLLNHYY